MSYDDAWPRRFETEAERLGVVFAGTEYRIEHVGSTSVPGLAAKPIIDIMIGVGRLGAVEARIAAIEALGYRYVPDYEDEMPGRRYFRRPDAHPRTHHLHCVELGSRFWITHLAFREHLRAHPGRAAEYGRLKRELAESFGADRKGYLAAKSGFIQGVLREAVGS